jgi:hypothetical protein
MPKFSKELKKRLGEQTQAGPSSTEERVFQQERDRDVSDAAQKPGDSKARITDFFQIGRQEEKKRQKRQEIRMRLEQGYNDIQDVTYQNFRSEMKKIDDWAQTSPTHEKYIKASTLRDHVSEVYKKRRQANTTFEVNLTKLDQLAERDSQKSLSKTLKKPFSEEVSYDEQIYTEEGILESIRLANEATWKALEEEMDWRRERYDRERQIVTRETTVKAALTYQVSLAADYSRAALRCIDEWKEINPHSNLEEGLRGEVKVLYDRYNRTSTFQNQWQELSNSSFSKEQVQANHDLIAREDLLTGWERFITTLQTNQEGDWNGLHQQQREQMLEELTEKQVALTKRPGNLTNSIDGYSQTELQEIYTWEKFIPGNHEGKSHLAKTQRERVHALYAMQIQDIQVDSTVFEQELQKLDRRQFSNEEVRTNRDITIYGKLLKTWSTHLDMLASIQQARWEYMSSSLALERSQAIGSSTNEGESELDRGTREQRIEELRQQFASLTDDIRAYYRSERERPGPVRERVRALYELQRQSVQADQASFERTLPNLDKRHENLLNRWQAHLNTLNALHKQEREYLSASLALE